MILSYDNIFHLLFAKIRKKLFDFRPLFLGYRAGPLQTYFELMQPNIMLQNQYRCRPKSKNWEVGKLLAVTKLPSDSKLLRQPKK